MAKWYTRTYAYQEEEIIAQLPIHGSWVRIPAKKKGGVCQYGPNRNFNHRLIDFPTLQRASHTLHWYVPHSIFQVREADRDAAGPDRVRSRDGAAGQHHPRQPRLQGLAHQEHEGPLAGKEGRKEGLE